MRTGQGRREGKESEKGSDLVLAWSQLDGTPSAGRGLPDASQVKAGRHDSTEPISGRNARKPEATATDQLTAP